MYLSSPFTLFFLSVAARATTIASTFTWGDCYTHPILGTITTYTPGTTYTSSIPTPTTTVVTAWIPVKRNPPKGQEQLMPDVPARTAAPSIPDTIYAKNAKRYPPLINRDNTSVNWDITCSETITHPYYETITLPDPAVTASTTVWTTTVTELVSSTTPCGPGWVLCS